MIGARRIGSIILALCPNAFEDSLQPMPSTPAWIRTVFSPSRSAFGQTTFAFCNSALYANGLERVLGIWQAGFITMNLDKAPLDTSLASTTHAPTPRLNCRE